MLSAWNVLVVDDEPHNAGVLEHVLQFHNARVRTASSGMGCLTLLREELPTLLLLDLHMPRVSGWEVIKQVRESEEWRDLPVIAVTAHVMPGDRERILAAGFDGYIPKPISPMTIIETIQSILASPEVSSRMKNR